MASVALSTWLSARRKSSFRLTAIIVLVPNLAKTIVAKMAADHLVSSVD